MDILNDPSMREVVLEFCQESKSLLDQLENILNDLEADTKNSKLFEKFGQIIDRMMGTAKSIQLTEIATFCELGKTIGYKASQIKDLTLLTVVVAIMFDTVELLRKMVEKVASGKSKALDSLNTSAFTTRLKWLSEKFKYIERSSVSYKDNMNQSDIDDLMKSLGL